MTEVRILGPAEDELLAAVEWYEVRSSDAGVDLIGEFERVRKRLFTFPDHGEPHVLGTRRVVLRRFPFDVVYVVEDDGALIVAFAHHRRKPGYWRDRL